MHLLLLHGAIGSSGQLIPLADSLSNNFTTDILDFSGHGGRKIPSEDFSIKLFANDVLIWMEQNSISSINIFGYSMGGYVALYLARHYPEKIKKIFTLATKFDWTPEGAERETKMLVPEKISEKLPEFALTLEKRHAPADWKDVLRKTQSMMLEMGSHIVLSKDDFTKIQHKVLLSVGDLDKMVSAEETKEVNGNLSNSSFLLLENTKHQIEAVNIEKLNQEIIRFLSS